MGIGWFGPGVPNGGYRSSEGFPVFLQPWETISGPFKHYLAQFRAGCWAGNHISERKLFPKRKPGSLGGKAIQRKGTFPRTERLISEQFGSKKSPNFSRGSFPAGPKRN